MVNFNGELLDQGTAFLDESNRGLRYGDALFDTIRVVNSKIFFWESHYLRLMASMRIMRLPIPMHFTMEQLEEEILETLKANTLESKAARVRLTVFRDPGGYYTPTNTKVSYIIEASALDTPFYTSSQDGYQVELFKDHYVHAGLLSTLKSSNKLVHILAGIYASENGYQNCLLLNQHKNIIEASNGNIFLVKNNTIKTPPITEGCLNGVLRKQLLEIIKKTPKFELEEAPISPFELQKADEMFITNVISGIISVSKYRKKQYDTQVAKTLLGRLNAHVRLL